MVKYLNLVKCDYYVCPAFNLCARAKTQRGDFNDTFFTTPPIREDGSCEFYYPVLVKG